MRNFILLAHPFRSREVGQSYLTSILSTIWSFFYSVYLVWQSRPQIILANGPGTCLPICVSAFILKVYFYSISISIFMFMYSFSKIIGRLPATSIFLSESYACVNNPSLTTRLLYPFIDVLFVQWAPLMKKYKKAIYSGRMPLQGIPRYMNVF
jgi:beta-1,4-N-acetylglucosaminyltransferase